MHCKSKILHRQDNKCTEFNKCCIQLEDREIGGKSYLLPSNFFKQFFPVINENNSDKNKNLSDEITTNLLLNFFIVFTKTFNFLLRYLAWCQGDAVHYHLRTCYLYHQVTGQWAQCLLHFRAHAFCKYFF